MNSSIVTGPPVATPSIGVTPPPIWHDVCAIEQIVADTGVCAMVDGRQIAIFRVADARAAQAPIVFALDNFDPFSKAMVLSRGILGDRNGIAKVASPIYKQSFALASGQCLDDPLVSVPVYPVRIRAGRVEVAC